MSTSLPAKGTLAITGDADNMTVFAVSADAQELFTKLAEQSKLNLVVDDIVSRRITVSIKDRPARPIVDDIASAYGLSVADVAGVTMISEGIPRSPSSYLLSDIESIPLKYVNAATARNLLPVFLQDYVKVNSEQNAVVLSAPTEVLKKFRADIAQFDIPASQILVDLLLVELTNTSSEDLGLNFIWQNGNHGLTADPTSGTVQYQTIGALPTNFDLTLKALEDKGLARVRANPRVTTVSGRKASIFVGQQRYLVTPIDNGKGQQNHIDAGVQLSITPYTGGQGQILIDVDSEVSTLSALDPITHLPEKSTRTASTAVRVNDGETIVIGGLVQQESHDTRTKIPILGDIPLLGPLLFTTKSKRDTETQLVLFITPHLLNNNGHLPADQEATIKDRYLNGNWDAPLKKIAAPVDPPIPPSFRLDGGPASTSSTIPIPIGQTSK